MSESINFLKGIDGALKRARVITIAAAIAAVAFGLGCFYIANQMVAEATRQVYVLDQGSVLTAIRMQNDAQRDLEIADHVRRYHELMFNISPDSDIINDNFKRAVKLGGQCAVELDNRRREQKFYEKIIEYSAIQTIRIDNIEVDMSSTPYRVFTTGTVQFLRQSTLTKYSFNSECLVSVLENRSFDNPHGLIIDKFIRLEQVEQSQRRSSTGSTFGD